MRSYTCSIDRLDAYLIGDLAKSEETELVSHLDVCRDCRETLQVRAAEDAEWSEAEELLSGLRDLKTTPVGGDPLKEQRELGNRVLLNNVLEALGPTDDPEMLGRLDGYEVSGIIGSGGMGVVLKAHDRSLDRAVAIKVMSPHLASNGSARQRFTREAKAAAAVLHPNVIAIHSVATDGELPYLVMPYLRGESLQKRLDREGPLPVKEILRIGSQVATGLAAAHAQGLVHRDIKPANILLEDGVERVTITDFGLARAVDDATMTRSGVIAGTPQYMSPEQARGEPVDQRSDLFGLGSVLYALCTGRAPFRAETTFGVLRRLCDEEPRPIRETNPSVPEWLSSIIASLMLKRREDRFESAEVVGDLLEGCLAHTQEPASVPLPGLCSSLPQTRGKMLKQILFHKNSGVIAMVTTACLALAGLIGLGVVATNPNDIGGSWKGDAWGIVALEQTKEGVYEGTYADAFGGEKGKITLKWSRIERRFKGTWSKDEKRCGRMSLRRVGEDVRGAWTTNKMAKIDGQVPDLADFHWVRYVPDSTGHDSSAFGSNGDAVDKSRVKLSLGPSSSAGAGSGSSNQGPHRYSPSAGAGSGGSTSSGGVSNGSSSPSGDHKHTTIRCQVAGVDGDIVVLSIAETGSRVKRGDLLVELDSNELKSAVNSKTVELHAAEAKLEETLADDRHALDVLQNRLADAENIVASSKVALEAYLNGSRVVEEKQLKALVENARDSAKELQDNGFGETAIRKAKSELEVAELKLHNFERFVVPKKTQELEHAISSAERALATVRTEIESFNAESAARQSARRSAVAVHRRRVEQASRALKSQCIYAPHGGVVGAAPGQPPVTRGSTVRQWQKLMILHAQNDTPESLNDQVLMEMLPTGDIVLRGQASDVKNALKAFGSKRSTSNNGEQSELLSFRGVVQTVVSKNDSSDANDNEESAKPHGPEVCVFVEKANLGRVPLKQSVIVTIDAFPGKEFPGKVSRVASNANPAIRPGGKLDVHQVTVIMTTWPDRLKQSMTATVKVDARKQSLGR